MKKKCPYCGASSTENTPNGSFKNIYKCGTFENIQGIVCRDIDCYAAATGIVCRDIDGYAVSTTESDKELEEKDDEEFSGIDKDMQDMLLELKGVLKKYNGSIESSGPLILSINKVVDFSLNKVVRHCLDFTVEKLK